jgi:thioredoxin 1
MDELDRIRAEKKKKMMEKIKIIDIEGGNTMENGKPVDLSDSNFNEMVNKNSIVIVDFWADWCGPCRMLAPIIEELAKEYCGKATVAKLNVDFNPTTAQQFRVMGIPTMLFFKDGKLVDKIVGVAPKPEIESKINQLM